MNEYASVTKRSTYVSESKMVNSLIKRKIAQIQMSPTLFTNSPCSGQI